MGLAFAMALASFGMTALTQFALAGKIMELGKAGERNPDRLCDDALKSLRLRVNAPRPPPLPASPLERERPER
jgi:hypothetical protein